MKYSLRALVVVMHIAPPVFAACWSFPAAIVMFFWCAIATLSIAELVNCWRKTPDDSSPTP